MTPLEQFFEWAKGKDPEYVKGFLDGLSQSLAALEVLYKNSASNDTE